MKKKLIPLILLVFLVSPFITFGYDENIYRVILDRNYLFPQDVAFPATATVEVDCELKADGGVTGDVTGDTTGNHVGNVTGTGASTFPSVTITTATITKATITTLDANGGTIDGTTIGGSTPAAGSFTTLTATTATITSLDANGGTIDGTTIGGSTPGAGSFTSLSSTTGITGDLTGDVTGDVTGGLTIPSNKELVLTASSVALTSPTVTFSADAKTYITLTSDANQTGIYPTGGSVGQVIFIISGSGSNTMRFDDGAKTHVGSNVTLTEGQYDTLCLICIDPAGDVWSRFPDSDN
jgi:hypothetical protein